jgi:hypothetical protein
MPHSYRSEIWRDIWLTAYSWDSTHEFEAELSILLMKRQRNLKHIELHATAHTSKNPCISRLYKADMSVLKCVERADSLHFEPSCNDCIEGAKLVLEKAKNVKKFKLSGFCLDNSYRRISSNDEGVISDPLFTALFSHLKEPGAQPLQLTRLSLDLIDLTECKVNYANVLSFETLKRLRLRNCWRPDLFLDCMMHPNHGRATRLQELIIENHEDENERLLNSTLDRFLKHSKGLTNLQLYLMNIGTLPTLENIIWHGDTLEKLFVCVRRQPRDPTGNHESYTAPDQLAQLCSSMPQLKQLALSFPDWPVSMDCKLHKDKAGFKEKILVSPIHFLPYGIFRTNLKIGPSRQTPQASNPQHPQLAPNRLWLYLPRHARQNLPRPYASASHEVLPAFQGSTSPSPPF